MITKTIDLYEAAWYKIKGGTLKEVHFGKASENDRVKKGFIEKWLMTWEVEPQYVKYWREHRPMGNIREYANARLSLKRKIYKMRRNRPSSRNDTKEFIPLEARWKPKRDNW